MSTTIVTTSSGSTPVPTSEFQSLAVNSIRCLAADMVQKANSGHPGAPMGCAPIAAALWGRIMNFNPNDCGWLNRDRFVLSNGHACALQYIMLYLTSYPNLTLKDLESFRQLHSKTPGHPESFMTPGVEVCTGPLGQGISNAVGMAIAEKHLAARYNVVDSEKFGSLFDSYTYVLTGDGCLMEGVASEACSLAGHLGLNKLIVFYDDNNISIDGSTDLAFTEDVGARFTAYGWNVMTIENGNDPDSNKFVAAVEMAKSQKSKPTLIKVKTTIGFGSVKEGSEKTHGAPLGADDIKGVKEKFGMDGEKGFQVPPSVKSYFEEAGLRGSKKASAWNSLVQEYIQTYPDTLGKELARRIKGELPADWKSLLPKYTVESKTEATRVYSGACLKALSNAIPDFLGGCADLAPSCNTKHVSDFQKNTPEGRYLRFGVREHAMAAICNGITAYWPVGFVPYCATFMVFWGYAWGSVRLSALSKFPVLYVGTHDSIDLGEDGPTHQPIEIVQLLRSTPNFCVIRPADGEETVGSYICHMEGFEKSNKSTLLNSKSLGSPVEGRPTCIVLSRSGAPNLVGSSRDKVKLGAYVISAESNANSPEIILSGSGQEVESCLKVKQMLIDQGIAKSVRVVSFPSWTLFEEQSEDYQLSVLPSTKLVRKLVKSSSSSTVPPFRVFVESCSTTLGSERYGDLAIVMESFGASAPGKSNKEEFGFTVDKIFKKVVEGYKGWK